MLKIKGPHLAIQQLVLETQKEMARERRQFPGGARQRDANRGDISIRRARKIEDQNDARTRHIVCETENFYYDCDRKQDSYCEVEENGEVFHIKCANFHKGPTGNFVQGHRLKLDKEEFFRIPYRSSGIGIRIENGIQCVTSHWPISSMRRKLYRLPLVDRNKFLLIPLLHSSTGDL
jgi:hypothetical protein